MVLPHDAVLKARWSEPHSLAKACQREGCGRAVVASSVVADLAMARVYPAISGRRC
jgi:hypothetical protein